MQLLTSLTSPFGRIPRIVHRLHNLDVTEVVVNPWQDRSPLEGKNAMSKIPVLILDDETPIIDSWVICEYFDSLAINPLLPKAGLARLKQQSRCALVHDAIMSGTNIVGTTMLGEKLPEKVSDWHLKKMTDSLREITSMYQQSYFGNLKNINMLDVCVATLIGFCDFRLKDNLDLNEVAPKLYNWYQEICEQNEIFKETIPRLPK